MAEESPKNYRLGALIGVTPEMCRVFEMIEKAATIDVPVLLVGETGTGKELAAREIHRRGMRAGGPFVAVNTGSLSPELVASELFGHAKGAFTGAVNDFDGRFAQANRGTLFLDEIATMNERTQVVLLRSLEEHAFRPVGARQDKTVDVRVLAATNSDLRQLVDSGVFREDLLQRLTVFRIVLPALREHLGDLRPLALHFLKVMDEEFGLVVEGISEEAFRLLEAYSWPGNVRELKNAIAQAAVMAGTGVILPEHIPPRINALREHDKWASAQTPSDKPNSAEVIFGEEGGTGSPAGDGLLIPWGLPLEEVEKAYSLQTLARCGNNRTRTAKVLGISRRTLHSRLARWGIQNSSRRSSEAGVP